MNLSTALVLSSAILGGSLLVSNLESQMTSPPAIESHAAAAPAPQCNAAEVGKCECFDKGGCKCVSGKQCQVKPVPLPHGKAVIVKVPRLRDLTTKETLNVYAKHIDAVNAWVESDGLADSDHSMRELVQLWLTENPRHDPRLPRPKATTAPHEFKGLSDAGNDCVVCWQPQDHPNHDFKSAGTTPTSAPLYTQPTPVAKPKAAPRPVVRYYYVTPRQQGGCSNGSCGSGGRRGIFGRRR
jgi:hypothetical protein